MDCSYSTYVRFTTDSSKRNRSYISSGYERSDGMTALNSRSFMYIYVKMIYIFIHVYVKMLPIPVAEGTKANICG
jgi:hypothetical protein